MKKGSAKKTSSATVKAQIKSAKPSRPVKRFNKKELNYYREKLLNLKDDLLNQIQDISKDTFMKSQKEVSGNVSGYGMHLADAASDNYERDFSLDLVSSERRIVLEIDAALKRVEDGTFGICGMSGKAITRARLNAIPYARYTKECQEQLERENKI